MRKWEHRQKRGEKVIREGNQTVHPTRESTRWPWIWLASTLTLAENRRRGMGKTRQAKARLRRIVNRHGVPPAAAKNLQMTIAHGTMLYASEVTWDGKKGVGGEHQAINRMGRASLGTFRSTPLGALAAESKLALARALSNNRQASFAQRLLSRPVSQQGPEEVVRGQGSALIDKLCGTAALRPGEVTEEQDGGGPLPSRAEW